MSYYEKAEDAVSPQSLKAIACTPDQLRTIADRLEQEARRVTVKGETVYYQLTPKVVLVFSPVEKATV